MPQFSFPPGYRPLVTLLINDQGQLQFAGPLEDKARAYGFLKLAEKVLDKHYAQVEQPRITPFGAGAMRALPPVDPEKGNGNGG